MVVTIHKILELMGLRTRAHAVSGSISIEIGRDKENDDLRDEISRKIESIRTMVVPTGLDKKKAKYKLPVGKWGPLYDGLDVFCLKPEHSPFRKWTIVAAKIRSKTVVDIHRHLNEELLMVASGSIIVWYGFSQNSLTKVVVGKGESVFFRSMEWHKVVSNEDSEYILVMNPALEEIS